MSVQTSRWLMVAVIAGSLALSAQASWADHGPMIAKKSSGQSAAETKSAAGEAGKTATPAGAPAAAGKPLSVKLISVTTPVHPGDDATVSVQTAPKSQCEIIVKMKSGKSTAKGLEPKEANNTGKVSWTWKVAKNVKPGTVNITCNCSWAEKKGSLDTTMEVK